MKIFIKILFVWLVMCGVAQAAETKMRENCPIKLSEDEQKKVRENLERFLTVLSRQDTFSGPEGNLLDLRCIDLSGKDFLSRKFSFLDLRGSNLDNTILQNAYITATDLSQASMRNIRGPNVRLENCAYDHTDFSASDFNSAQFLTNIDKDNINKDIVKTQFLLKNGKQSAQYANFTNTNLSNSAALRNMDLSGAVFDGADLSFAAVDTVFFDDTVSFKNTKFKSTRFTDTVKFGSANSWTNFLISHGAQTEDMVDTSFGSQTTNFAAKL